MGQSIAKIRYEGTWNQFLSKRERNPRLTLPAFLRTMHVDKKGFMKWMESQGFSAPTTKHQISRPYGESSQENVSLENQLEEKQEIKKMVSDNNNLLTITEASDGQNYWWINLNSETWNIDESFLGAEKSITFFEERKRKQKKSNNRQTEADFDGQFLRWLYCYLIDREDNPHFGQPIAQRELAISLLDYPKIRNYHPIHD